MRYCQRCDRPVDFAFQPLEILPAAGYRHLDLDDCDSDPEWSQEWAALEDEAWRLDADD